jgi:hypothetical protein
MITATMATTAERTDEAFAVARAIVPQVDRLVIAVNNCTRQPEPSLDGLTWLVGFGDLGDNAKFLPSVVKGWHFTIDDDLNYPPDYVARTLRQAEFTEGVVSWHGAIVRPPIESYYRDKLGFHCLGAVDKDQLVHIPGTGVMAYRVEQCLGFSPDQMPVPYMADIWVGIRCQKMGIPVTVLAHESGWITHRDRDQADTIWGRFHGNDQIQTWLVNQQDWT